MRFRTLVGAAAARRATCYHAPTRELYVGHSGQRRGRLPFDDLAGFDTVLVETVFDWPGIGLYAVNSAIAADFKPVMGVTLVIGFLFMLSNLLVDLAYGWLDPRTRGA